MDISGVLQKESPTDQQLHLSALQGNVDQLKKVLESGKVHVDSKDKVGTVCLVWILRYYAIQARFRADRLEDDILTVGLGCGEAGFSADMTVRVESSQQLPGTGGC